MPKFPERLRALRIEHDLSQLELAKQLGISKSSVNMYERGAREPGLETLEAIADRFNVDMDYLMGKSEFKNKSAWLGSIDGDGTLPGNILPMPEMRRIPLVGAIACGTPILAEENLDGDVDIPAHIHADFALRCKGDSMIDARIFDGDIVYIRAQPTVENGEIAAVRIGDEATLKRVYFDGEQLLLVPANAKYGPKTYSGEALAEIRIEGKAVAFTSAVR